MSPVVRARLWMLIISAAVVGVAVDVAVDVSVPGRAAAIGFIGCALIIYVAKWVGQAGVQHPEGYYADDLQTSPVEQDGAAGSRRA